MADRKGHLLPASSSEQVAVSSLCCGTDTGNGKFCLRSSECCSESVRNEHGNGFCTKDGQERSSAEGDDGCECK